MKESPPTPEDALKAVEALTEILRDLAHQHGSRVNSVEHLNALRMGCEAIRMGHRESAFAREILDRRLPA